MILFFYGPNTFASKQKLAATIEAYEKKSGNNFGVERIDGEETDLKSLAETLQASPFLAASRLVIISYLSKNKLLAENAIKLLNRIPDSTVVVFYEQEIDSQSAFYKTLKAKARAVKFDLLSVAALQKWVKEEVAKNQAEIDEEAAQLLVEIVGDDQWRLEQEILKLVNYSNKIKSEDVKAMVEPSFQQSIFDLIEAMSKGDVQRALSIYKDLITKRTDEMYILNMITWQLRNLILAKTAGNITPAELAQQTGMSPFVASKALAQEGILSEEVLKKAFLTSLQTNYAIKTGHGDADQLIEHLILKITRELGQ